MADLLLKEGPIKAEGLRVGVVAELNRVDGQLSKRPQCLSHHLVAFKQAQKAVEVMSWRRDLAEMHQPGLEGFFDRLLQPVAPGTLAEDRGVRGGHRCLQVCNRDAQ